MTAAATEHAWCLERIVAYRAGLLTGEQEEQRYLSHLERCEGCRAVHEEFAPAEGEGEGAGHIPHTLLARWERTTANIRGLERRLVARHIERCDDCRAKLEVLGFAPLIELEEDHGAAGASTSSPVGSVSIGGGVSAPRPVVVRRARPWLYAWACAASVAAVFFGFREMRTVPMTSGELTPNVFLSTTRGGDEFRCELLPGARSVVFQTVLPPSIPADAEVRFSVLSPRGRSILDNVRPAGLVGSHATLAVFSDRPLALGAYDVRVSWTNDAGTATTVAYRVTLAAAAGRNRLNQQRP